MPPEAQVQGIGSAGGIAGRVYASIRSNKLLTNAGVYVFGNLLQKVLSFLLIPLYTRFLTPEDYGISGLCTAITGMMAIAFGFGIYGSISRHYYDYRDSRQRMGQFITTSYLFAALAAGTALLFLLLSGPALWARVSSGQVPFVPYVQIALLTGFVEMLVQIPLALYRAQQRATAFVISQAGTFLLTLVSTIVFVVFLRWGARGQLLGYLVGYGVMSVVLSVLLLREWWSLPLNSEYLRASLGYGLPLVPHSLAGWALSSMSRLLLEARVTLAELGLYNLGFQLGLGMSVLVNSINMAWLPYYYDLMKRGREPAKRVRQVTELYVAIMGGLCLLGSLFSREIITLLAPARYLPAARYVPLILFSFLVNGYYYFASMPLFYHKQTRLIPVITGASALLNLVLNLWWIPLMGALGSAWATLASWVLALVLAQVLSRRWDAVSYSPWRFGGANAMVLAGVLFATYGSSAGGPAVALAIRVALLCVFVLFALVWLVRPNLKLLRHA